MKRTVGPITSINKFIYNFSDFSCGRAGQTGGAFGFALIFLFLFPSREKENKEFLLNVEIGLNSFLSFVCPKERNKKKASQKQMLHCFWLVNAHEQSLYFEIILLIELIGCRSCFVLFVASKGAVFFVCILYSVGVLLQTKKKTLEDSQKENIEYRRCR